MYFVIHKQTTFKIFTVLGAIVLAMIIGEIILRTNGYQPGRHTYVYFFEKVDSLYTKSGFRADKNGIFKIDTSARRKIRNRISNREKHYGQAESAEVFSLPNNNIQLLEKEVQTALSERYFSLLSADHETLSDFEKEIIDYVHDPINQEGFRSLPFHQYNTGKPSVLLLGDSFTWGFSASNLYNSFADHLLAMGYVVYNTGITATDIAQYLAVARKYIPRLQPDYVIVNFYLGNDISYYKREVKPYQPNMYPTNAGNLMACPHSEYFISAKEAYQFFLDEWYIPKDGNLFDHLMAQTAISTQFWKVSIKILAELNVLKKGYPNSAYYERVFQEKHKKPYSNQELKKIKKIANRNGSAFLLSSIPEVYADKFKTTNDCPDIYGGLAYHEMEVNRSLYDLEDGHFNDNGHELYASFLDSLIQNTQP